MVCDEGSTGTNKDKTYVNLVQAPKFHNFTQLPSQTAMNFIQEIGDCYDILKNCLKNMPHGDKLITNIIKVKHSSQHGISFYYNTNNVSHIPDLNKVNKEQILFRLIIMNGNIKEADTNMLRSQQIAGTKLFDLSWGQASSLLDCESQKVIQRGTHNNDNNNNGGGKKQNNKKEDETDGNCSTTLSGLQL